MKKQMIIMLICVAVLFGGIFGYKAFEYYMTMKFLAGNAPPVTVSTTKADYQAWQPEIKSLGTVRAIHGVNVTTEIAGMVNTILFVPGNKVKKGDLLVQLNAATDYAHLASLEALADLSGVNYERDKAQYAIKAVSKAVLDADMADLKDKKAKVNEQLALIAKKNIRAPFDGYLGISAINLGQYLNPGDKIVSLQSLDPIYVDFYLPQHQLAQISKNQSVKLNVDAYPQTVFAGKITAIDPVVAADSRNVLVEATFANPHHKLVPGMFTSVEVDVNKPQKYLTLPQTAISYNPYGEIVYLIQRENKDNQKDSVLTVKQMFINVIDTRDDQAAVKGLKPGDEVVTSGQLKLKNGAVVIINNSLKPLNNSSPSLEDK